VSSGGELDRPRDLGELLRDSFGLLAGRPAAFMAIGLVFAVPIELGVSGVGLEQLTAPYEEKIQPVEAVVGALSNYVLTTPLVTVACALLVAGAAPTAGRAAIRAVEASTPLVLAAIVAAIGVAVGLFFLIIPGLYLLVRWFLFPQAVALEDRRGVDPLRRSGELIEGRWIRAAGVILLANLIGFLPGAALALPFGALAVSSDREWPILLGQTLGESISAPIVAVMATVLFYDLRARRAQPFG
jgi:hypothetical protein